MNLEILNMGSPSYVLNVGSMVSLKTKNVSRHQNYFTNATTRPDQPQKLPQRQQREFNFQLCSSKSISKLLLNSTHPVT